MKKTISVMIILMLSLNSHALFFCGVVEKVEETEVSLNIVDDSGKITGIKASVGTDSDLKLAKLIEGNSNFKLCTADVPVSKIGKPFVTEIDSVLR